MIFPQPDYITLMSNINIIWIVFLSQPYTIVSPWRILNLGASPVTCKCASVRDGGEGRLLASEAMTEHVQGLKA
jgi:hypothetical protein